MDFYFFYIIDNIVEHERIVAIFKNNSILSFFIKTSYINNFFHNTNYFYEESYEARCIFDKMYVIIIHGSIVLFFNGINCIIVYFWMEG